MPVISTVKLCLFRRMRGAYVVTRTGRRIAGRKATRALLATPTIPRPMRISPPAGSGCQKYDAPFPGWGIAVIVVGSVLLLAAIGGGAFVILREKRGDPLFMRLDDVIEYERKKRAEAAANGVIMVDIKK